MTWKVDRLFVHVWGSTHMWVGHKCISAIHYKCHCASAYVQHVCVRNMTPRQWRSAPICCTSITQASLCSYDLWEDLSWHYNPHLSLGARRRRREMKHGKNLPWRCRDCEKVGEIMAEKKWGEVQNLHVYSLLSSRWFSCTHTNTTWLKVTYSKSNYWLFKVSKCV